MKKLTILLFAFLFFYSCKEKCISCIDYEITNKAEVQKKCDGLTYDLSIFKEEIIGQSWGHACNSDERKAIEKTTTTEIELCNGVFYTQRIEVRCDWEG